MESYNNLENVLLQAAFVWEENQAAPTALSSKKNDILAGTEFLSVFINGAMAPRPTRRRINLKYSNTADNVSAESKNDEANIFRISRAPIPIKSTIARPRITLNREEGIRYYPISHKLLDNRQHNFETIVDDLGRSGTISAKLIDKTTDIARKSHNIDKSNKVVKSVNQKVIGVSVTSTVEATPYKVRVEHHNPSSISMITRPPSMIATTIYTIPTPSPISSTIPQMKLSTKKTEITPSPAILITEELSNIVSESNRSEFSVEEEAPKMKLQDRTFVTPRPTLNHHTTSVDSHQDTRDSIVSSSNSEPVEQRYEFPERNSEIKEINHELSEVEGPLLRNQGRKVGRHFDDSSFNHPTKIYATKQNSKTYENQHSKVYIDSSKTFGETSKIYGESEKIYSEPSKVYSEPTEMYGESSKPYSESAKVYSKPSKIYEVPQKVYSESVQIYPQRSKIYSEPSKVYSQRVGEPEEKNYEIDETVSVGSNGNVHGPQSFTEATNLDEDGHKVGYVVEGRNYRKYRVEERTPDGFIVGEYGVVSHDDGSLRGVRYTADGTINPRLIYDALMKFLAL